MKRCKESKLPLNSLVVVYYLQWIIRKPGQINSNKVQWIVYPFRPQPLVRIKYTLLEHPDQKAEDNLITLKLLTGEPYNPDAVPFENRREEFAV